jgi:C4-dicarboxylate-specific signal transduction histidine kinase
MMIEFAISTAALLVGLAGFACGLLSWKKQREQRALLEFLARQNEELEKTLTARLAESEEDRLKLADHARKIAWLETRVRKPQPLGEEIGETEAPSARDVQKSGITERRHRVLKLASLGQDAATIAATLGMMSGEVELIVKLGQGRN